MTLNCGPNARPTDAMRQCVPDDGNKDRAVADEYFAVTKKVEALCEQAH